MKRNRILKNALKATTLVMATAMTFGYSVRNLQNNKVKAYWPVSEETQKEINETQDFVKFQLKLEEFLKENGFYYPRVEYVSLTAKGGILAEFTLNDKHYKVAFVIDPSLKLKTPTTYEEAIDYIDNFVYAFVSENATDEKKSTQLAERFYKLYSSQDNSLDNYKVIKSNINFLAKYVLYNPGEEDKIYKHHASFNYLVLDTESNVYKNLTISISNFYHEMEQFNDINNRTLKNYLDVYEKDSSFFTIESIKTNVLTTLSQNYLTKIENYYNNEYDYIINALQKENIENVEEEIIDEPEIEEITLQSPQEETDTIISTEDFFKNVNASLLNGQSSTTISRVDYAPSLEKAYKKEIEENIKNYDLVR